MFRFPTCNINSDIAGLYEGNFLPTVYTTLQISGSQSVVIILWIDLTCFRKVRNLKFNSLVINVILQCCWPT